MKVLLLLVLALFWGQDADASSKRCQCPEEVVCTTVEELGAWPKLTIASIVADELTKVSYLPEAELLLMKRDECLAQGGRFTARTNKVHGKWRCRLPRKEKGKATEASSSISLSAE